MSTDEGRKLQIKIAQLNARLQVCLAWLFGLIATSLGLMIFGYQLFKENNFLVSSGSYIGSFVLLGFVYEWMRRANRCSKEFERLQ